jgi:hypothetical protein
VTESAEGADRGPHLLQVGRAGIATGQVALKAVAVGQRALEVARHELDRLPASERGATAVDQVR